MRETKDDKKSTSNGTGEVDCTITSISAQKCKAPPTQTEHLVFFKPNRRTVPRQYKEETASARAFSRDDQIAHPSAVSSDFPSQVPLQVVDMEADMVCKSILGQSNKTPAANSNHLSVATTKGILPSSSEEILEQPSVVVEEERGGSVVSSQQRPFPPPLSQPGAFSVEGLACANTNSDDDDGDGDDDGSDLEFGQLAETDEDYPYQATLVESQQGFGLEESETVPSRERRDSSRRRSSHFKPDLVVDAAPYEDQQTQNIVTTRRGNYWIGLSVCFVVVIVATIFSLGFPEEIGLTTSSAADENPDVVQRPPPTNPPNTSMAYPPFRDDLNADSLRELQDPNSPTFKANSWMWQDPNLHTYSRVRALQRFALGTTYYATNGDNWFHNDGWLSYDIHECDWWTNHTIRSTTCEKENSSSPDHNDDRGRIVSLELAGNNLHGTIPYELDYLFVLQVLDLGYNNLYGTISAVGDENVALEIALVNHNQLEGMLTVKSGHIPDQIREIDMSNNLFKGQALNIVALLPGLEILKFSGNEFTEPLHGPTFGALVNLTTLHVSDSHLIGPIPSELGSLSHLKELDLSSNDLTGSIPLELSFLPQLEVLNVDDNLITGTIPEVLCNRTDQVNIVADCSTLQCCQQS